MKISVITPVYKAEKFLPLYFKAIKAQTFRDFEIIFIDGDSPDNAGIMVEEFKKQCEAENQDFTIQVLHKKNEGAASSRNAGLRLAKGEYVVFVDGDDWPDPDYLKVMYDCISTGSDLGVTGYRFGFKRKFKNRKIHKIKYKFCNLSEPKGDYISFLCQNVFIFNFAMPFFVWNKIYKLEIIKQSGAKFDSSDYPEDIYFNFRYIEFCKKICYTKSKTYNFYYNSESLSKNRKSLISNAIRQMDCTSSYVKYIDNEYDRVILDKFFVCSIFVQFFQMDRKLLHSEDMRGVWGYLNSKFDQLKLNKKFKLKHFKLFLNLFWLYKTAFKCK